MSKLKSIKTGSILIDQAIPLAKELFSPMGQLTLCHSRQIDESSVAHIDALIVRSVTPVNSLLLKNSRLSFVGSATIGRDHLDEHWLKSSGISVASAPGCNARAVVQYVLSALSYWSINKNQRLNDLCVGVVGYGAIGQRLISVLKHLKINYKICDPLLAKRGVLIEHKDLVELAKTCDVLSFHVPLTEGIENATHSMINEPLLSTFKSDGLLINTARGKLVVESDLLDWIKTGGSAVLDVWPEEPCISQSLLSAVLIGTPHIAGYSLEGKYRATLQVSQQLAEFFGDKLSATLDSYLPEKISMNCQSLKTLEQFLLKFYPIESDWQTLKKFFLRKQSADGFDTLRDNYQLRREYCSWELRYPTKLPERLLKLKQQLDLL